MSRSNRSGSFRIGFALALLAIAFAAGYWLWPQKQPTETHARQVPPAVTPALATRPAQPASEVSEVPAAAPVPAPPPTPVASPTVAHFTPAATPPPSAASETKPASSAPVTVEAVPNVEMQATARMYAAHAPLRTREVADPDSPENRATVQTMLLKSLEHAQPSPPKN